MLGKKGGTKILNSVVLVGRLTSDPEVIEKDNKKITTVTVAVTRNYKNAEGKYDSDFIRCVLWNGIASSTSEYCRCGDIIGLKGRIQTSSYEDENNNKKYVTEVIAEKVTFLSSCKKENEENKTKTKSNK